MRYQWWSFVEAVDSDELREVVFDARRIVPTKLASLADEELRQHRVA
jgi:hypothetical protein